MPKLKKKHSRLAGLLAILTAISGAAAQTTEPTDLPATLPVTTAAARGGPRTQPATAGTKFTLNFKDAPLENLLNYFSDTLGFEIVKDAAIDARVNVVSKQPISSEEAMTMLEAALRANGYTAIRDGRILHIASRDKAKKGNVPVHFGKDPADIAETDEIITQVIPIDNVSASKLLADLKNVLPPDADTAANDGSNSIVITDSSSDIHRVAQIIAQLDSHEASTAEVHIVPLKHANATSTAKLIDELFKTSGASGGAQPNGPQNRGNPGVQLGGPGGPGGPPGPSGGSERHGQGVVVVADDRTNSLLIMASTTVFKAMETVIAHLDSENPVTPAATVMHFYTLKYAAADATSKMINDIFKGGATDPISQLLFGRYGGNSDEQSKIPVTSTFDERTNMIIVTAPPEKVKDVEALIEKLDASPMVSQDLRIIHLKHADAEVVSKLVEDMYTPKKDDSGGNNDRFGIIFLSPVPQEAQVRSVRINVNYDERTNTVLVSAPTAMLDSVEKVVHELDADPTTEDTFFIYHLRNGQAAHLGQTLNTLFGNETSPQNNQQNRNQNIQPQDAFSQSRGTNGGLGSGNNNGNGNGNGNGQNPNSTNRNDNGQQNGSSAPGSGKAVNELTGKVFVVPDNDTNSLLVTTASKYKSQVLAIINDLDHPVPQVLIKMLIAEVSRDDSSDVGVDYSVLNLRASDLAGAPVGLPGQPLAQASSAGVQSFGNPGSGLVYSLLEDNIQAQIHALAKNGKLDVLSRPYILASDNQDASILVGQSVPFITSSVLDNNNNTINTVQYRDIGIILNVTPHINPDGQVILDVAPEISSQTATNIQLSPNASSPVFQRRTANSRVTIMNGQTIVIGGLMQDQNNSTLQKVPLLGDIPILGLLFQRNQVDKTKTELLIFLTPHVASAPGELPPMSKAELSGTKLTPDAVGPGVYQEHLHGLELGKSPATLPVEPISPVKSIPLTDPAEGAGG